MKPFIHQILFCIALSSLSFSCTNGHSKTATTAPIKDTTTIQTSPQEKITKQIHNKITDIRDGEIYQTIMIGRQIWMAENLRFETPGSMVNPENPSKTYGRLYGLVAAQSACPSGWHMPTDREWDELEMAHGMPAEFIDKGGWRGEHATQMKSDSEWDGDGNGTNSLGFNVLPAGYYFSDRIGAETVGMQGLGYSAAYWSAMIDSSGYARFMFSPKQFVNKWEEDLRREDSGTALSCRCVKD